MSKNWPKLHKITHNSKKNRVSTEFLPNLVGVFPRNTHTKFETNPCNSVREEVAKVKSPR